MKFSKVHIHVHAKEKPVNLCVVNCVYFGHSCY